MSPDNQTDESTRQSKARRSASERQRPAPRRSAGRLLLWLLVSVSILLNLLVINQLLQLRRAAQATVLEASAILGDLKDEQLSLTIPIDQTIIIDTDLPVEETISVPIQTELPISTTVTATVDAGILGDIPLDVPIETTVPVDLVVDVPIEQTFAVRAPVSLELEVPVEITVSDTPLYDTLEQAQTALEALAAQLDAP